MDKQKYRSSLQHDCHVGLPQVTKLPLFDHLWQLFIKRPFFCIPYILEAGLILNSRDFWTRLFSSHAYFRAMLIFKKAKMA